jgi:hypothetical protein
LARTIRALASAGGTGEFFSRSTSWAPIPGEIPGIADEFPFR